jgi:hypothetical protein
MALNERVNPADLIRVVVTASFGIGCITAACTGNADVFLHVMIPAVSTV